MEREREHLEHGGVGEEDRFLERVVAAPYELRLLEEPDGVLDLRQVAFERGCQRGRLPGMLALDTAIGRVLLCRHAENPVRPFVHPVERQLVADVEEDERAEGEADGEARDVDEAVELLLAQVAERDREVVPQHSGGRITRSEGTGRGRRSRRGGRGRSPSAAPPRA